MAFPAMAVWLRLFSMAPVLALSVATIGTAACEAILLGEKTPHAVKKAATRPAMMRVATQPATICRAGTSQL